MKLRNFTTLGICASLLIGGTIAGTSMANAQGAGVGTGAPPQIGKGGQKKEKHPEIRMALKRLEGAKDAMQKAASDFGGHKSKAIDATNIAISELREALKFDNH